MLHYSRSLLSPEFELSESFLLSYHWLPLSASACTVHFPKQLRQHGKRIAATILMHPQLYLSVIQTLGIQTLQTQNSYFYHILLSAQLTKPHHTTTKTPLQPAAMSSIHFGSGSYSFKLKYMAVGLITSQKLWLFKYFLHQKKKMHNLTWECCKLSTDKEVPLLPTPWCTLYPPSNLQQMLTITHVGCFMCESQIVGHE